MTNENIVNILKDGIVSILQFSPDSWAKKTKFAHDKINYVLKNCKNIEYTYIDGQLLFNKNDISDDVIKKLLDCYRRLSTSFNYPDSKVYDRICPKILHAIETINEDIESCNPNLAPVINISAFIDEIRSIRNKKKNDIVLLLNDRGFKGKYIQVFDYSFKDVSKIEQRYSTIISTYKNWCLYKAYNSINALDKLIEGLVLVSRKDVDIINNENECYGAIMCTLTIIDKIILFYPQCHTYRPDAFRTLLLLCFDFMGVYLNKHEGKDWMRTAEIHVNRARLCDRMYYYCWHVLALVIDELIGSSLVMTNPFYIKFLYIYDMDYAFQKMPIEYYENYDYRMSANMMHQHQQVTAIFDVTGDTFDTNYGDICELGMNLSVNIEQNGCNIFDKILTTFATSMLSGDFNKMVDDLFDIHVKSTSPYIYENKHKGVHEHMKPIEIRNNPIDMDRIICVSFSHQLESYTEYGMVVPSFIPIRFKIEVLLLNCSYENKPVFNEKDGLRYYYFNRFLYNYSDSVVKYNNALPSYPDYQIIIITDKENNMIYIDINSYDFQSLSYLHSLSKEIRRTKQFCNIPVVIRMVSDESISLQVCFQIEDDINSN